MTDWGVDKLVRAAQAFDRSAQRNRELYSDYRRLAFDARKWARHRLEEEVDERS